MSEEAFGVVGVGLDDTETDGGHRELAANLEMISAGGVDARSAIVLQRASK